MIEMNQKIAQQLKDVQWENVKLNRKLGKVVELGFFKSNGCVFFVYFRKNLNHLSLKSFEDRTGFEALVNHIHIDDYYKGEDQLGQGLKFFSEVFQKWNKEQPSRVLIGILSTDEETQDVTVRVHVHRTGERWLAEDLEGYEMNGILMTDSKEPTFSH